MKNLLFVLVTALFILSCGENKMEQEAKKLAELTFQLNELTSSGRSNSAESQAIALATDIKSFMAEIKNKYSEDDQLKFAELYKNAFSKMSKNTAIDASSMVKSNSAEHNKPELDPEATELTNKTVNILKSNIFIWMGASSVIYDFEDNTFTFRVIGNTGPLSGKELCRAVGTYQVNKAIDGSLAKINLYINGDIQKSPFYADNRSIDTELFIHANNELRLKLPTEELIKNIGFGALALSKAPDYLLVGRETFISKRNLTRAEKDSIANEERKQEEKKRDLEEKLKGL